MNIERLTAPGKVDEQRGFVRRLVAGGAVTSFDTQRVTKDGRVLDVWMTVTKLVDKAGKPIGIASTERDTTALKREAEKLRETNDYLENLIDHANAPIIVWDPQFRITRFNGASEAMSGRPAGEVVGKSLELLFPPALARSSMELIEKTTGGERWETVEIAILHRDGSVRTVLWNSATILAADGRTPMAAIAQGWDITERKRAEEEAHSERVKAAGVSKLNVELERHVHDRTAELEAANRSLTASSAYSRSLIEASLDPLVTISPEGRVTDVNEGSIKVTGVPREKLIGTDFSDYFTEPDKAREGYQEVFAKGFVTDYPLTIRHKDGRLTDVLYNASVYRDARGAVLGVFAAARDVTERRQAEEETHRLNAELERRVVERTAQLDAANKELEAFSYSVSHDLRAPLRHVQGYVDMLGREAEGQLSENGRHYMKTIADASREMGVLIDDLLAFSRMGRVEMRETSVDLNTLVQDTLRDLEPTTSARNIVWRIAPLPAVHADPAMLRLAVTNLLSNAVKFTRPRDPAQIEIGSSGADDGRVILFVRDNGVGFDPQYAHKLFCVFQRLHRADEFEGTGIGLANVQRIIARHGGRTWAEGTLNEGATFYITLKAS